MNAGQFISGLVLIVLSAGLYFASRSRKAHASQLNQSQTLDLQQSPRGRLYGKFQGSIVADQQLTTPYSVRPAVTWSAHLEKGTEESDEDGSTTNWETVWSQSASTPFRLKGSGELWFDERGGLPNLDEPSTFDQYIHDITNPIIAPYLPGRGFLGRLSKPNFHAIETSFAPGTQAFFIGPVEAVNGFWVARRGDGKEYSVLTWKSEQQVRSRMSRASTVWLLLSLIALVAGILAIIISFS
ncbi:MAG TPA: GIDE domain-containing protein, partial [Clostridia bacterium]|nr:GIDE domain-containing protein [Clostridia bacterium]